MTRLTYKTGRPRKSGDRYPGGKLKPQNGPNAKVVAMRRALLGADDGDEVDLTMAENPMDLAFARGWISEPRHRAGKLFANLYRGIRMPALKVSRDTSEFATAAPSPVDRYFQAEEGLEVSGVVLPVDTELGETISKALEDLNAGRITHQQYATILTRADRKRRASKINWANLPAADVARLFDSVMAATRSSGGGSGDALPIVPDMLRELWGTLKPEEARELFTVCCLGRWPEWIVQRVVHGGLEPTVYRRRRKVLEAGLDKVAGHARAACRHAALASETPLDVPVHREAPVSDGPAQMARLVDRTVYVDPEGTKLFEVERIRRVV